MDRETKIKKIKLIYVIGALLTFLSISITANFISMVTFSIIFEIILYLTMGYGAYISWKVFRSSKNKAWLLICIFCLSIFFTFIVRTSINSIFHERIEKNNKTYLVDKSGNKIETKEVTINFPIFNILLVIGLYYLAKDEIKRNKGQKSS